MSSTDGDRILQAIHSGLVKAVKNVVSSHEFGKDIWFNYIHQWAPPHPEHNTVSRDPANYNVTFLGDFLQCVSRKCEDETAIQEFTSRKVRKVERVTHSVASFTEAYVENLWIVVGDGVLHGATHLAPWVAHQCREVALPSNLVHHSGGAVSMLLTCISAGIVEPRLRIKLASEYKLGCIHFEGKFYQFPSSPDQKACRSRIDNLNNTVRAFGVDAKATRNVMGQVVRSNLHPRLQHFVGIGVGASDHMPCFHLDLGAFLHSLTQSAKKVLFEGRLVEALYAATIGEHNGITTWFANPGECTVSDILRWCDQDNPNTLVLVLTPSGTVLEPPSSYDRTEPSNIWVSPA